VLVGSDRRNWRRSLSDDDRAALAARLFPLADCAGHDAEPGDDLSRWSPGNNDSQSFFAEIGGMKVAFHRLSVPNRSLIRNPIFGLDRDDG
jgi:hypothetical protein